MRGLEQHPRWSQCTLRTDIGLLTRSPAPRAWHHWRCSAVSPRDLHGSRGGLQMQFINVTSSPKCTDFLTSTSAPLSHAPMRGRQSYEWQRLYHTDQGSSKSCMGGVECGCTVSSDHCFGVIVGHCPSASLGDAVDIKLTHHSFTVTPSRTATYLLHGHSL